MSTPLSLSRRGFLKAGAGAALGGAAVSALDAAAADDKNPFGGFTVGIQSYTFRNFKRVDQALPLNVS